MLFLACKELEFISDSKPCCSARFYDLVINENKFSHASAKKASSNTTIPDTLSFRTNFTDNYNNYTPTKKLHVEVTWSVGIKIAYPSVVIFFSLSPFGIQTSCAETFKKAFLRWKLVHLQFPSGMFTLSHVMRCLAGHVLRRLDLSNMMNYPSPYTREK